MSSSSGSLHQQQHHHNINSSTHDDPERLLSETQRKDLIDDVSTNFLALCSEHNIDDDLTTIVSPTTISSIIYASISSQSYTSSIYLSIYPSIYISIYLSFYLSIISMHLSIHLSILSIRNIYHIMLTFINLTSIFVVCSLIFLRYWRRFSCTRCWMVTLRRSRKALGASKRNTLR